ncbi:Hcp family type VI secretion system effector [Pseudomonas sp. 10B1]|uniref:Hcp family type VI secretion system effector n=1 Tax=unclassified Pseudomonas TaxID=196821 RepID=UPI002AB475B6|nr:MULTISPECIES: Hcp family type VI secretion system effector [unclassified Pseudomonas]MDY7562943.1 Hcp family type VI secretion system effector [Pseudomonas sp. AB6]MEA9995470.1 Hcp family type VI secretion system effector [Pseudomonas sp. AA4]MEB0085314.1 Hcp family type VI secretion system effector [Pseudomonas sp. RTI1]MEB0125417.1 Hcp family type VI secretion system effector [Pseudomonas sp. CCC1.2]MEB0153190.1 Hcp family type VI secretion system effector [Pseudomonas sp. CCC4.3]
MPMPPYLTIIGEKQKLITEGCSSLESIGNNYQLGREDQILVESFDQHFGQPQGAQPGHRVHGPFTITKMLDKSTPLLFEAWRTGETLSQCKFDWYRISPNGFHEHFFTMVYKDALITDIHIAMPHWRDPAFAHITQLETVTFTYRNNSSTHETCGTMGSDYWNEGASA